METTISGVSFPFSPFLLKKNWTISTKSIHWGGLDINEMIRLRVLEFVRFPILKIVQFPVSVYFHLQIKVHPPALQYFPTTNKENVTESETTEDDYTTDISESAEDDPIQASPNEEVGLLSPLKRKRSPEEAIASHTNTPRRSNIFGAEFSVETLSDPSFCMFSWDLGSDLVASPAGFLQNLKPETSKYHGNNREFIQVAHSVMDQLSLETDSLTDIARSLESPYCQSSTGEINAVKDPLQKTIQQIFPQSEQWNLHQLITSERESGGPLEAIVKDNSLSRTSQKENVSMPRFPNSPSDLNVSFPLSNPFARIRRNQKPIDIAGSALQFWEELGLEPAHGTKNILALYICPAMSSVRERLCAFATMIGSSYQNCKLGTHESVSDLAEYPNGLVPALSGHGNIAEKAVQLSLLCEKLGTVPLIAIVGLC